MTRVGLARGDLRRAKRKEAKLVASHAKAVEAYRVGANQPVVQGYFSWHGFSLLPRVSSIEGRRTSSRRDFFVCRSLVERYIRHSFLVLSVALRLVKYLTGDIQGVVIVFFLNIIERPVQLWSSVVFRDVYMIPVIENMTILSSIESSLTRRAHALGGMLLVIIKSAIRTYRTGTVPAGDG